MEITVAPPTEYRTRYYVCGTHHRGDHQTCPKRYKVPADLLEQHIAKLIKADLSRLRDDSRLHQYVADELARITGSRCNAGEQLQRRLADLDQQLAKLRDHLKALDFETAQSLGLYDDAKTLADEQKTVEAELSCVAVEVPKLPGAEDLRRNASAAFDELDRVLADATIEEKRELIGLYVETIKADPDTHSVQIGLYSSLFTRKVAGEEFEPSTSGL